MAEEVIVDYGRDGPARRRCIVRVIRRTALVLIVPILYIAAYFGFTERAAFLGSLFIVKYPGAARSYALSDKGATSIGHSDEMWEQERAAGITVHLFKGSIYQRSAWYAEFWRVFYPLERAELAWHGAQVVQILYPVPGAGNTPTLTTEGNQDSGSPIVGAVYREWFVRGARLFRFVGAVHAARSASNELRQVTDVFLFEWNLTPPFEETPRPAERVRRVETTSRIKWEQHWLVDDDHCLVWNEDSGLASLLQFGDESHEARTVAKLEGIRPLRCNTLCPPTVSRSGRFFAAEMNGIFIFRSDTLQPAREVKLTAALQQFFAERPDELDNTNSVCFLTDDAKFLVRVATFFNLHAAVSHRTVAIVYDIEGDSTRDVPLNIGRRADISDMERVGNELWFYVRTTDGQDWSQWIIDEASKKIAPIRPGSHMLDMVRLGWDPNASRLVEFPGFSSDPQQLQRDSEVLLVSTPSGQTTLGRIRYGDNKGYPDVFAPGEAKLDPSQNR